MRCLCRYLWKCLDKTTLKIAGKRGVNSAGSDFKRWLSRGILSEYFYRCPLKIICKFNALEDAYMLPTQLDTLRQQQGELGLRYADVAIQLRALETQERELSAALRVLNDQVKLALTAAKADAEEQIVKVEDSGHSPDQTVKPEVA